MNFSDYITLADDCLSTDLQVRWYERARQSLSRGRECARSLSPAALEEVIGEFSNRVRTEELKAWYGAPDNAIPFQGTSISALTVPAEYSRALSLGSMEELEDELADSYVRAHDAHESMVRSAILEDVDAWMREGLFYGVVIASKIISQALHLSAHASDVVFDVKGVRVDPHEIVSCPSEIREAYFELARARVDCFGNLALTQEEFEASLILADISKPRIEKYKSRIILAPVRCNEIAAVLARRVRERIVGKTNGRIRPRSLNVVIYDTDTPYTYHHLLGCNANKLAPVLPGLTVLGSSGTMDAFRWLYAYRVSLIAQKLQKGSLYSESCGRYLPFVFFGVLVPRDAEILLDMDRLDLLRYRGNLDPELEFLHMFSDLHAYLADHGAARCSEDKIHGRFV